MPNYQREIKVGDFLERPSCIGIVLSIAPSKITFRVLDLHKTKGLRIVRRDLGHYQNVSYVKIIDPEEGRKKMIKLAFGSAKR